MPSPFSENLSDSLHDILSKANSRLHLSVFNRVVHSTYFYPIYRRVHIDDSYHTWLFDMLMPPLNPERMCDIG